MKITINELLHKLNPYFRYQWAQVHNLDLLKKELRRTDWRADVLYACDNLRDYFPVNVKTDWNWRDQKQIRMPKKWRIPKSVFDNHRQVTLYHLVEIKSHVLKVVPLKKRKPKKGHTLYIDCNNEHIRIDNECWYKPSDFWCEMGCECACHGHPCDRLGICLREIMRQHGFDTSGGNHVKKVEDRALDDFQYKK